MKYEIKICPFRESGQVDGYHEVYYNLRENEVIFYGFKLNRKKYLCTSDCKAKAAYLLKEICKCNEFRRLTEICGVDKPAVYGGNYIRERVRSHFAGRTLQYVDELSDLYKLAKMIFGVERF